MANNRFIFNNFENHWGSGYNLGVKILALDVGEKSCGIALSDALHITAQGQTSFYFDSQDWSALFHHLQINYLSQVELIIIGLPLLPSGDKSNTTRMIEQFHTFLAQQTQIPLRFIEESYTTKHAHEIMIEAGLSRYKRKQHVDKIAAMLILQKYLNTKDSRQ